MGGLVTRQVGVKPGKVELEFSSLEYWRTVGLLVSSLAHHRNG